MNKLMENKNKMNKIYIVDVLCRYLYSLTYFFKEEFYIAEKNVYVIPTKRLLAMKRKLLPLIVEGHGEKCDYQNPYCCNPNKFKNCLEDIFQFLENSITEEGKFYEAFEFFPDEDNENFFGWSHIPINRKCLKHLSYSAKMQYLH